MAGMLLDLDSVGMRTVEVTTRMHMKHQMTFLAELDSQGLKLLPIPKPIGNFRNFVRTGSLIFISGQGPREADCVRV